MPNVLMIAFHYPPFEGGSGVHRTLKFSKYLPQNGWRPIILTANSRAYPKLGVEQLFEIPTEVIVKPAFALDAARHLSLAGRYSQLLALPDRWASWWWGGVFTGLSLIRQHRPSVLWSTYPIATAHLIAWTLHRLTGLPWVADFRDSMTEDHYPRDPLVRRTYRWIERKTVGDAARILFTAPSTRRMYLERYRTMKPEKCVLVPNGFDEGDFNAIRQYPTDGIRSRGAVRLLHAGLIYTDDRDPTSFFRAVSRLKKEQIIDAQKVTVDLRASGSDAFYAKLLAELEIDDIVRLLPAVSHRQALGDCSEADALIIFQAESCNHQIPAKAYEYLRLQKPILALTSKQGDTARLLADAGGATIVDLASEQEIYEILPMFIDRVHSRRHGLPDATIVQGFSREYQTSVLSACLTEVSGI
jgi:glycosyltransferase involved in cell wall biosynthesis